MKSMISQADAVFKAACEIVGEWTGPIATSITKEQRGSVHDRVVAMFLSGETGFRGTEANQAKLQDEAKLKSYVVGLVSNHFRKDKRLNGNVQYVPKNPGSRPTDSQLRELRKLLGNYEEGTEEFTMVQEAIAKREGEIASTKSTAKPVDYSAIPADLRESLGIDNN